MRAAKKMDSHKVATTTSLLMEARGVSTAKVKEAIAKTEDRKEAFPRRSQLAMKGVLAHTVAPFKAMEAQTTAEMETIFSKVEARGTPLTALGAREVQVWSFQRHLYPAKKKKSRWCHRNTTRKTA